MSDQVKAVRCLYTSTSGSARRCILPVGHSGWHDTGEQPATAEAPATAKLKQHELSCAVCKAADMRVASFCTEGKRLFDAMWDEQNGPRPKRTSEMSDYSEYIMPNDDDTPVPARESETAPPVDCIDAGITAIRVNGDKVEHYWKRNGKFYRSENTWFNDKYFWAEIQRLRARIFQLEQQLLVKENKNG